MQIFLWLAFLALIASVVFAIRQWRKFQEEQELWDLEEQTLVTSWQKEIQEKKGEEGEGEEDRGESF